jgi:MFS family permease
MVRVLSTWARTTFLALSHGHYRILWAGTTLAFLAYGMSGIVQNVVAYDLTGKNGAVGAVALGMGISQLLVAPFGGVLADRVAKRKLLLIGQTIIALDFYIVGVLVITGQITLAMLFVSTFVLGMVFSFIAPARQAWIGEILPKDKLGNGVALQQVSMTLTRVFGPLIAGFLVGFSFTEAGGTYIFMGGVITLVVLTLAQLPKSEGRGGGSSGPSVVEDMRIGLQHVTSRPRLLLLGVSFICFVMFGFSHMVLLPGYLENALGRDPKDISWMYMASAITGLLVTVGLAGYASSRYAWRMMVGAGIVFGVSLMLTGVAPTFVAALGTMLLVGAGSSLFQMLNNALIMQESSPEYYGRVMSLTMLAWGMNGIAGLPFGLLGDAIGERATMGLMGVLVLVSTVLTGIIYAMLQGRGPRPLREVMGEPGTTQDPAAT